MKTKRIKTGRGILPIPVSHVPGDRFRILWTMISTIALVLMPYVAAAGPVTPKAEITATAAWFDSLTWPDIVGKPYVEITLGKGRIGQKEVDGPKLRGFLLNEDEKHYAVFSDGTVVGAKSVLFSEAGWPFVVQRIQKSPPDTRQDSQVTCRVIELPDAVKEILTELHRPRDEDEQRRSHFGRRTSDRTALFVLARCCARQGRADLAEQLDAEVMMLPNDPGNGSQTEKVPFRTSIEKEIAHVLMWKAVVDCGDATVSRPELLAEFERIVRDFPASEHRERAAGFVQMLRTMIAEDEAHAQTVKPMEEMNTEEKVHELIFRLRDQNGHQWSQPGACDIFDDWNGARTGDTPAHQLVKLGHAAVPALIKTLGDKRLSRSVGYHRDFYFSHFVLTVGDCAEAILSRIAGRSFWVAHTTSAAMQKDGQTEATRAAVEEWWRGVQDKGEKGMLVEGVSSGGNDSAEQASRLAAIDPAAALDAIAAGIRAAKSNWVRTRLVEAIAAIKTEAAARALEREMKSCASLHGRVAAAMELFRRGNKEATVPVMTEEWKKWKPVFGMGWDDDKEDAEPLIVFLGGCGDVSAMKALAERFASLPIDVKFKVLEVATETRIPHEQLRDDQTPLPAEVEALGEELAVGALEDRAVRYGMSGSRGDVSYRDPRVCDYAAYALAERWPKRYTFKWLPTRLERDPQILQIRNIWREAHGLQPLPLPERSSKEAEPGQPNVVSSIRWTGGAPLAKMSLEEGKVLTADALIETFARLHRELPKDYAGFDFAAERAGNHPGFVVEVEWVKQAGANPGGAWMAGGGWSFHIDISLGDDSLYNSGGGGSFEHRSKTSGYEDEKRALTKALAGDPNQAVSISFSSRLSKD